MGLSFLLSIFARRPDGGLFGYLKRLSDNKTKVKLAEEYRASSAELIRQLAPGDEYRERTAVGWREIRKAPVPQGTLVLLSEAAGEHEQVTREEPGLPAQRARSIGQPGAPEEQQQRHLGSIGGASQPDRENSSHPPAAP